MWQLDSKTRYCKTSTMKIPMLCFKTTVLQVCGKNWLEMSTPLRPVQKELINKILIQYITISEYTVTDFGGATRQRRYCFHHTCDPDPVQSENKILRVS